MILVPTDGSAASRSAIARARALARAAGTDLRILPAIGSAVPAAVGRCAEAEAADLIVVAQTPRWGGDLRLLGSVADEVAHRAPCSVLVDVGNERRSGAERSPGRRRPEIRSILAPVDFSEGSRRALARALRFAEPLGARVDVLHVLEVPRPGDPETPTPREGRLREAMERLDDCAALCRRTPRVAVERHLRRGRPARAIARFARERSSDLVVLGARGRRQAPGALLGRVAEELLWRAPCPVLVVRG